MRFIYACILVLACKQSLATEFTSKFEFFAYYEPISIYDFVGDWQQSTYTGGEFAWHFARIETSISLGNWQYSIQLNDIALSKFTTDTAELQMRTKNGLPLNSDRYDISMEFDRVQYYGLEFAKIIKPGSDMTAKAQFALLNGIYLNSGVLHGSVSPNSLTDYDFGNLHIDYHYSEDPIFDEAGQQTKGYGFSLSGELFWQISPRFELNTRVINLFGLIHWPDAPFTDANVVTDTKTFDQNGYAQVEPAIQGQSGTHAYNLVLPYIIEMESKLALNKYLYVGTSYIHTHYVAYFSNGVGIELKNFYLDYQRTNRLTANRIRFGWKYFHAKIMFDTLSIKKAKNVGLGIEWTLSL